MKDDKIFMPKFINQKHPEKAPHFDICLFMDCSGLDCDMSCALGSSNNFKKWQEQCKDKQIIAAGTAKTTNSKAVTV